MCLIVVGWQAHADYPLVVAANRDEFHARPTAPVGRWPDAPNIVAGRDLQAGGTWLGMTDTGRFAAVTNVREPGSPPGEQSRGALTRDFLAGQDSPLDFAERIEGTRYAGFNLLLGDRAALVYLSNRDGVPRQLTPGIYGLSNHRLDTPWPKLVKARQRFAVALPALPATEDLFGLLADDEIVPDAELPATGVTLEWERRLSAIFVRSEHYGTRASTVLWRHRDGRCRLIERAFGPAGRLQSSEISTTL